MGSSASTNTVSSCLSTCSANGYAYGGVEYGVCFPQVSALFVADHLKSQCFCGSSLASSATSASSSNCNYSCSGGSKHLFSYLPEVKELNSVCSRYMWRVQLYQRLS
ncbi:hypothetical protein DFH07DRAFT_553577 [Mycena maculata]|uniref:WSC domain-containing protein n=1 Tax=Mycena maculata TaxID=230809 RepID=A0AAD7IVE8_9AGAR|nr:hypothetical protein DFH07DRAFT_553577 [Mycena maculata]